MEFGGGGGEALHVLVYVGKGRSPLTPSLHTPYYISYINYHDTIQVTLFTTQASGPSRQELDALQAQMEQLQV